MILEYLKLENKIQVNSSYIIDDDPNLFFISLWIKFKKLKFKNVINDFIIFQYNTIKFINYKTVKTI